MNTTTLFSSFRCKVRTQNGTRCKMMTKNDTHICHFHISIKITECCVCMEQMLSSDQLGCQHYVCRKCVKCLRDTRCPMCRREIRAHFIRETDKEKMRERFVLDREQDKMEEEERDRTICMEQ